MKKLFILLLAAVVLSTWGCSKEQETGGDGSGGDNTVKIPDGYAYTYGGSVYVGHDGAGRVSDRTFYDYNGKGLNTTVFEYFDGGVVIKEYNSAGDLISESFCNSEKGTERIVTYQSNGKKEYRYENAVLVEETYYNGDTVVFVTTYRSDGTFSIRSYKDGEPSLETEYNTDGIQVKSISFGAKGQVLTYTLYGYNADGKNDRVDVYDADDNLTFTTLYTYNAAGAYDTVTTKNGKGVITGLTEYVYDENGKQTIQIKYTYEDGDAVSYEKWVVDENGNSVLEGVYDT